MNILVSKICILYISFYMDLNFAQTLEWNPLIKNLIDKHKYKSFERPSAPKGLIIFIVNKPNLRSYKIKNPLKNVINEEIEPYKSLHITPHQEMRSKSKKKEKIEEEKKDTKESSEENDDVVEVSSEEKDDVVEVSSEEKNHKKEETSEETFGGLKLTKKQSKMLRRRWNRSCDKKAARVCKKACRLSYKHVCRAYRCFRSQKRSFKRECSRNCKMKFRG